VRKEEESERGRQGEKVEGDREDVGKGVEVQVEQNRRKRLLAGNLILRMN
jgi:hypothetical protein